MDRLSCSHLELVQRPNPRPGQERSEGRSAAVITIEAGHGEQEHPSLKGTREQASLTSYLAMEIVPQAGPSQPSPVANLNGLPNGPPTNDDPRPSSWPLFYDIALTGEWVSRGLVITKVERSMNGGRVQGW